VYSPREEDRAYEEGAHEGVSAGGIQPRSSASRSGNSPELTLSSVGYEIRRRLCFELRLADQSVVVGPADPDLPARFPGPLRGTDTVPTE